MWDGAVDGLLAGPPCESWSVAPERWYENHEGPRPLRNRDTPWGFSSLLFKEARQVYVANGLLFFALASHFVLWSRGKWSVIEHPAPPDEQHHPNAPSIWRLVIPRILMGLHDVKPTTCFRASAEHPLRSQQR
eukprot:Skav200688  [mRNA]  locus=scaffold1446:468302:468700:- [translate_table: standard]